MFTWICPKCGREVPPAYDECPDCAARAAAGTVAGAAPPPAVVPPAQQPPAGAPQAGPRGRRPLWATGSQDPVVAAPPPPPAYAPPPPAASYAPPAPVAAAPAEAPVYRQAHATSPLFQEAPAAQPQYAAPPRPHTPTWLTGIAIGVIVVMVGGAIYWFFGRSQPNSAVAETATAVTAPAAAPTATGNPVEKFVEVTGVRFEPITKGIVVKFLVVNHSDQDLVGLTGSANITAKTNTGGEVPVGAVKFQTSLGAHASQELTLPFETKKKMVDMPDWQNVGVKVSITSPSGA